MKNQQTWRFRLLGYAFAFLITGIVLFLSILIYPVIEGIPTVLFFCAVIVSAWYGGTGPSILASALSTLALNYYFLSSARGWHTSPDAVLTVTVFFLVTSLVATITARQRRAQRFIKAQQEWLHITLASIGDAIIVTDGFGCVIFLNSIAEHLTGWSQAEAMAKPIEVVFHIVNQDTYLPVENPVMRVLRQGIVVGLANHSILITKHGQEIPIDDSGTPIRDPQGKLTGAVLIFRDITQQRTQQRLASQLAAIVESSDDAIIGKDLQGIITSWNRGAERIYGYTASEVIGQPISMLSPPDFPDETPQLLARIRRGERVEHYETQRRTKDGRCLDVSLSISPIYNAEGKVVGASKIARDITERKRREAELARLLHSERQARAEAEQAVESRNEFLSVAAHELRTPVTSLRGFAQLLVRQLDSKSTFNSDRFRVAAARIDEQSVKLTTLINQLLDISRIEAGRLVLEKQRLNIIPLIQEIIDREQATTNRHRLNFRAEGVVEMNIDPLRFEQVLTNLLDNAIKFSPQAEPIDVQVMRPAMDRVRITVTDYGVGIAPERRTRLFERFFQAHEAGYAGGMGLGLYISRQIIELHGGQIWAEFPTDGGTRFVISLPMNP